MAVDFTAIFRAQDKVSSQLNNINKSGNALSGTFKKLATTAAGVFSVAAVANFGKSGVDAFTKFENGMNEVFTLLPNASEKAMEEMSNQTKQLAKDMKRLPDDVVPALYQALSAGIPQDNVFSFLESANKAAVGGVASLEDSVGVLTTVVNNYGADVISVDRASDLLFTTVKKGVTTFPELARSIGDVLPAAASANVGFDQVAASLATLTATMGKGSTPKAVTALNSLFSELSNSSTEIFKKFKQVSGQSFPEFMDSGGDLVKAMDILNNHAMSTGKSIADLFGNDSSKQAINIFANNIDTLSSNLNEMGNATGATDAAFQRMEKGFKRKIDQMKANIEVLKINVGEKLVGAFNYLWDKTAPVIENISNKINELKDVFSSLGFSSGIEKLFGADAGAIAKMAEGYAMVYMGGIKKIFSGDIEGGTIDIMKAIGFEDSTINVVMKSVNGIWENLQKVPSIVQPIFAVVKDTFSSAMGTIQEVMNYLAQKSGTDI